jgi:Ca2+-binding RTX toxin-like protein
LPIVLYLPILSQSSYFPLSRVTKEGYDDTLLGGDGNDTIDGQGGNNFIDGGNGDDVLKGYGDSNTILGGLGNDSLIGGYGNDSLFGGDGNDTLVSDQGNDLLDGGSGNDTLQGGYGDDTYLFSKGQGNKTIWDAYVSIYYPVYAGNDTLVFGSNVSRSDLTWFFDGKDLTFSVAGATTEKVIIQDFVDTNRRIENISINGTPLSLTEIMTAYEGQDINGLNTLSWQSSSIKFNGLAGNDNIIASPYNDTLLGGDGNDTIDAQGGDDFINGGNGDDYLNGTSGNDTLDGGIGNDTLVGGTGNDSYFVDSTGDVINEISTAVTEIDSVSATISYTLGANLENLTLGGITNINGTGNSLNNLIIGNSGVNNLIGASGNDTIDGAAGNDILSGDDGNDSLMGGAGNDNLLGGTGNDILDGGLGKDILIGGTGNDLLTGGGGSDRFLFDINATFNASTIGVDHITDFLPNTDKIVLDKTTFTVLRSAAGSGFSTAADFASVADNAAAAISTAYITYSRATGSLFYNQNGSASGLGTGGEFANLSGLPTLSAADFMIQT